MAGLHLGGGPDARCRFANGTDGGMVTTPASYEPQLGTLACFSPAEVRAPMNVSLNAQQYTPTPMAFFAAPSTLALSPTSGPLLGGTNITVTAAALPLAFAEATQCAMGAGLTQTQTQVIPLILALTLALPLTLTTTLILTLTRTRTRCAMGAYLREWLSDGAATEQEWRDARGGAAADSASGRPADYLLGEHSAAALLDASTALCVAPTLERVGPNATVWHDFSSAPEGGTLLGAAAVDAGELRLGGAEGAGLGEKGG